MVINSNNMQFPRSKIYFNQPLRITSMINARFNVRASVIYINGCETVCISKLRIKGYNGGWQLRILR